MAEGVVGRTLESPLGTLQLGATAAGVRIVEFPGRIPAAVQQGTNEHLERLVEQLGEYFAGRRRTFELELDLTGTEFQREVWSRLQQIPFGQTLSYGELARELGRPDAARAVGAANGANHVAIVVPCHRVVAADGSLHGFGGGLPAKRWLLDHESTQGALF